MCLVFRYHITKFGFGPELYEDNDAMTQTETRLLPQNHVYEADFG